MKVLIFNSLYYPNIIGGAERSVQILAESLMSAGLTPVIVTTYKKDFIDYVNGIKIYYLRIPNLYWMKNSKEEKKWKKPFWHFLDIFNPFLHKKIKPIIEKEQPHIIHTNNLAGISVGVWKIAKKMGIPIIHTIRDYYLLCPKSMMFKNGKNCIKQCFFCKVYSYYKKKLSQKYVDGVVGISQFVLNKHLENEYFVNSKVKTCVYNPVVNSTLNYQKDIFNNKIVFGFIGTLSISKGIEFLLKAIDNLKFNNIQLFIYGKGVTKEYEDRLRTQYSNLNIFFKGFKEPEDIYNEIDAAIIPSLWHEPFSRILIEAYVYGIPVLASERGGIPENVIEGETGFLFNPNSEEDFRQKLIKMEQYLRNNKFSRKKIIKYAQRFFVENIRKDYIDIYNKIKNNLNKERKN